MAGYQQRGSILLISLMLLVVLTLMTFTISNSVLLQSRMSGAVRDDSLALQVAESALRDGERLVSNSVPDDFTLTGNAGFYDGRCDTDEADCYLNTFENLDFFADGSWTDADSRQATTPVKCPHGSACPQTDAFIPGRFKVVMLGEVDLSISGAERISAVTNQYQDQNEGAAPTFFLYRVIATGTGVDASNRRVIVSHFAAPVDAPAP
ncbi:MAG TPA: PilX N-terminal domain-containing pilus assembly protein [Pseudomonadales bacterium]